VLYGVDGGRPPAGKLLTGNIGSLCEQQPLKALRAPGGPTSRYKILYYYARDGQVMVKPPNLDLDLGLKATRHARSRGLRDIGHMN
jgi:hypothetical protein